jgi:hypothetical protein
MSRAGRRAPFRTPSKVDFLALLGASPTDAVPSDGLRRYISGDDCEVRLEVSFDQLAYSLQTVL